MMLPQVIRARFGQFLHVAITVWLGAWSVPLRAAESNPPSVPLSQTGAKASADYHGDAMGITVSAGGASLHTAFQKLSGTATREGLWLESTSEKSGRLRVIADSIGRVGDALACLEPTGSVRVGMGGVSFVRPQLVEEYSVSVDGVRQDFLVTQRPNGIGKLCVELAVDGGLVKAAEYGIKIMLDGSGRVLAYSRLKAMDARGRELKATMQVTAGHRLQVCVDDLAAEYPVRIDPTFSDANWVSLNPGIAGCNGPVYALAIAPGGNVYAGGSFTEIGATRANHVAKWNGTQWSALGSGTSDIVSALAADASGNLYVGGIFAAAGGVPATSFLAKWSPSTSTWSSLGSGLTGGGGIVDALVFDSHGNLYAAGQFATASGVTTANIAMWNPGAGKWTALGSGLNNAAYALAFDPGGNLYVGGQFTTAGGAPASFLAKWNPGAGTWNDVGSGMDKAVRALAFGTGGVLYAGGLFTTAGGAPASRVVMWDPQAGTWSALGSGMNNTVAALTVDAGGNLYAGGQFTAAGGVTATDIAMWNGSTWNAVGTGTNNGINALMFDASGNLYVGGNFFPAIGLPARNIAIWTPGTSTWSAPSSGLNGTISALAFDSSGNLYAGGAFSFITAGGTAANNVAVWNGSVWSALGLGTGGAVDALALDSTGNLCVGGNFTTAGGAPAGDIALWHPDTHTWSALGSGMNANVAAVVFDASGNLYAGGLFSTAGGATAKGVVMWNPTTSTWSNLGSGLAGGGPSVSALAFDSAHGNLYVSGQFTTAGGVLSGNIAMWSPATSTWSALPGISGTIGALALDSSGNLYAGGSFIKLSGNPAGAITAWNPVTKTWSALGAGITDGGPTVSALGTDASGNLFVGGTFTAAGGVPAMNIALWNAGTSTWGALGSGTDNAVQALAVDSHGNAFLGGSFFSAGTTISPYIIEANFNPLSSNTSLSALSLSTGTLSPGFAGGTPSYTANVHYGTTSITVTPTTADSNATVKVNTVGVTSGAASGPINLNVSSNTINVVVTAQDTVAQQTYTVNVTRQTNLQDWQQTYFNNGGNGALTADSDNDGVPNLIEFATGSDPTITSSPPGNAVANGTNIEFTYPRSDAALADGLIFTVEWSDTMAIGSWSNAGVTEQILSDDGTTQQVKALVPIGASTDRFVHLKVSTP